MRIVTDVCSAAPTVSARKVDSVVEEKTEQRAGRIPANVLQGFDKAAQALPGYVLRPPIDPVAHGRIGHPIVLGDPEEWREYYDVSQLDKAEALAEDAFHKLSPFNSNISAADRLQAQQEMQEAEQIRKQVEGDLDPSQRQQLDRIDSEEQKGFSELNTVGGGFVGDLDRMFAYMTIVDGAAKSKSLDNSILEIPQPPLPFPILFDPFGKTNS